MIRAFRLQLDSSGEHEEGFMLRAGDFTRTGLKEFGIRAGISTEELNTSVVIGEVTECDDISDEAFTFSSHLLKRDAAERLSEHFGFRDEFRERHIFFSLMEAGS